MYIYIYGGLELRDLRGGGRGGLVLLVPVLMLLLCVIVLF